MIIDHPIDRIERKTIGRNRYIVNTLENSNYFCKRYDLTRFSQIRQIRQGGTVLIFKFRTLGGKFILANDISDTPKEGYCLCYDRLVDLYHTSLGSVELTKEASNYMNDVKNGETKGIYCHRY